MSLSKARRRWWLPDTLFGRLALLLVVAVLASHVLALTLMFELHPLRSLVGPRDRPGPPPPFLFASWGLLLDISVRLGALLLAAWVGARWLSQPISHLARAAHEIGVDIHRPSLAEDGTQESTSVRRIDQRDLFGRALGDDRATAGTTLGTHVDQPVGRLDHIEVVFDDDDAVAFVDK